MFCFMTVRISTIAGRRSANIKGGPILKIPYRLIPEGEVQGIYCPLSLVFVDYRDVKAGGLTMKQACDAIAATLPGPAAINMFDMDAVTTNSDGIMIEGSMTCMAASDYGRIDKEFGFVEMMEVPHDEKLIAEEPHLRQWDVCFPGRRLIMGPDPHNKPLPIHNAVLSGRAGNNNSATEFMHCINMEELLFPVSGQMELMRGGMLEVGKTGFVVSVGIGMMVAEEYGRIVPHRQYRCGDTGHNSGTYAKYLKSHIPCIAGSKRAYARDILRALKIGMVPGRDISPSPAILAVSKYFGVRPDYENMTEMAFFELSDVGCTREWMEEPVERLSEQEILERAEEIIPGLENWHTCAADELAPIHMVEV